MTEGSGPYYREPCGGHTTSKASGPCAGHHNKNDAAVPRLKNTLTVPADCVECDNCEGDPPAESFPTARPECAEGEVSCVDPAFPCGPWPEPVAENVYVTPPPEEAQTVNLAQCLKRGFKNVFARKEWHGAIGYDAVDSDTNLYPGTMNGDGTCVSRRATIRPAITQKYLSLHKEIRYTAKNNGVISSEAFQISDCSIDRWSGKAAGSASEDLSDAGAVSELGKLEVICSDITPMKLTAFYKVGVNGDSSVFLLPNFGLGADGVVSFSPIYTNGENASYAATSGSVEFEGTWVPGVSILTFQDTNFESELEVRCDASGIYYRYYYKNSNDEDNIGEVEYIYEASFSSPYTASELQEDVDTLLAYWNLGNDKLYPWRTDTGLRLGPLMSYNERQAREPFVVAEGYEDETLPAHPSKAEGAVIGAPTIPGSDPYFNFYHVTYTFESVDVGINPVPSARGASSPAYCPHATQWVDNNLGGYEGSHVPHLPAGPFKSLGTIINPEKTGTCSEPVVVNANTLWQCKWAECILGTRPSVNFFRPCGEDREEVDTSTVDCTTPLRWPSAFPFCGRISLFSATQVGGNVELVLATAAPQLQVGDKIDFTGVGGLGTNVNVDVVTDPTHITVAGTLVGYTSGGFIQANGSPSYFWNDDRRKGQFVVRIFEHCFRDFWESYYARMTRQNVIDSNDGDEDEENDCPVPDAVDPVRYLHVEQTDPEGYNTIGTGSYWLSAATNTQLCTRFQSCSPAVIFISPNSETGQYTAQTVDMPDIELDVHYGGLWLARVEQWMTDPFWKAPGKDYIDLFCDEGCDDIEEDDGTGKADYINEALQQICIYPMRPWVEALTGMPQRATASTPEDAPALPGDAVEFACDLIARLNANPQEGSAAVCYSHYRFALGWDDSGCSGNPHMYRMFLEVNGDVPMPWRIQAAQESAARFVEEYQRNGGHA